MADEEATAVAQPPEGGDPTPQKIDETLPVETDGVTVDDDLLTDDEREAMAAGEDEVDTYDDGEGDDGAGEEEATPTPEEVAAQPDPATQPEAQKAQQPFVHQDFDAAMADLKAKADKLQDDWDNGDVSDEDYRTQIAEGAKAEALLEVQQSQYQDAKAADDKRWADSVGAYKEANPDLWTDDKVRGAFNQLIGDITSNPLYASLSYEQQIQRAHTQLVADAELLGLQNVPAVGQRAQRKADPAPKADPAKPKPPPSLAKLPSSDMNNVEDGRFAQLDRIVTQGNNAELSERAIASMTEAEQDAYGRGEDI